MWRITWKRILSDRRRLAGTAVAVVLGVAFLTAALVTGDTMNSGFDSLFSSANAGTDVVVRDATTVGAGEDRQRGTVSADLADELADIDGVAAVASVVEGVGQLLDADGDAIGGGGPPTIAASWIGDSPLNPWTVADGRAPQAVADGSPFEVVVDLTTLGNSGLSIGDAATVLTPVPTPVTIVGTLRFGHADSLGPTTYTAFDAAAATELFGQPGAVNEIRIAAIDGVDAEELRATIESVLPPGEEAITGAELTAEMLDDIESDFLGMFRMILLAFSGIALVVAAFSIHNTFSILVAQRTRTAALLRTVGADRRQVLTATVLEALVIGVIGSLAGLAAGSGIAYGLHLLMESSDFALGTDGIAVGVATVITAIVVGVGTSLLASVAPAVRASRVAPLAALRETAIDRSASSRVRLIAGGALTAGGIALVVTATSGTIGSPLAQAGLGALSTLVGAVAIGPVAARPAAAVIGLVPRVLRGQPGRLARRNAMRDPRRTASSASALMVGTAVVALFVTVGASIKSTVEGVIDRDFGGDLVIMPASFGGAGLDPELATALTELPEVASATGMGIASMRIDGEGVAPAVADVAALNSVLDLDVVSGSLDDVAAGSVVVGDVYAQDHDLAVGSTVVAEFADGTTTDLTVAATIGSTINTGEWIISPQDWAPHTAQLGDVVVLVDLVDGVSEDTGVAAVTTVTDAFAAPEPQTRSEYVDTIGAEIDQMLFIVYGMLAIAVLIAVMGIANTLSLSIHERTRELGMLRALGQSRSATRSAVRWESVIVAVFGTFGGIVLGTFLGWGLLQAVADELGYGVVDIPVGTLGVVLGLAALAGVAAAWRPARRAAKVDVLDALVAA